MSRSFAHPLAFVVPFTLAFALACGGGGGNQNPPPPPSAPTGPAAPFAPVAPATPVVPPAPAAKTFDQAAFTCCDAERADRLLDQYLDVERNLFKGGDGRTNGEYTALKGVAQGGIDRGGFSADDNAALQRIVSNCDASMKTDIAGKRTLFKSISTDAIAFLKRHSTSGSVRSAVGHCPMFEGGADWIQTETTITNPYYGSSMPACGSFQ